MAGVVVTVAAVPTTKFYVVDDNSANKTFEYDANGNPVESYSLNTANTAPRGAASTIAGDTTWVVDNNRKVYVYDNNIGGLARLLDRWYAIHESESGGHHRLRQRCVDRGCLQR